MPVFGSSRKQKMAFLAKKEQIWADFGAEKAESAKDEPLLLLLLSVTHGTTHPNTRSEVKLRLRSQPIDKQSRYNNREHNLTQCITNRSFLKHGVPHLIRPTSRIGIWIQRSDTAKSSFHKLFHQPSTHLRNFSRPIFTWKIQLSDHPSEAHPNSGSITNEQTFSKHFTFKNNWFPNENLFVSVLNWPILTSYFSHTRNIITRFLHLINHSAASE